MLRIYLADEGDRIDWVEIGTVPELYQPEVLRAIVRDDSGEQIPLSLWALRRNYEGDARYVAAVDEGDGQEYYYTYGGGWHRVR